jgi:hypothetical protein
MARIRTIKPEFWGDPKVARCSIPARLLFLGLLNESDDEGRQLGNPRKITGFVFPNDHDVTTRMVKKWLDELEMERLIHRYSIDGVEYLLLPGFTRNQKINRPSRSRLPAPPDHSLNDHGGLSEGSLSDLGSGSRNKDLGSEPAPPPWRGTGEQPIDFIQARKNREAG